MMPGSLAMGKGDFQCTICRQMGAVTPFERRTDIDGRIYDLWQCLDCLAILNATDLRRFEAGIDQETAQANSSDVFYDVDDAYIAALPATIEANGFTRFLIEQYPEVGRRSAMDFGAGQGITSAAAAEVFDRVYATDLAMRTLITIHAHMPQRDRIILLEDFRKIDEKLDAVYAIHTLEHLPNLRDFMDEFVKMLAPGGAIFFQVPLLLRFHLVCVHYTFFTEASCRAMAAMLGLDVVGVWYAHDVDFLNCILRKPF